MWYQTTLPSGDRITTALTFPSTVVTMNCWAVPPSTVMRGTAPGSGSVVHTPVISATPSGSSMVQAMSDDAGTPTRSVECVVLSTASSVVTSSRSAVPYRTRPRIATSVVHDSVATVTIAGLTVSVAETTSGRTSVSQPWPRKTAAMASVFARPGRMGPP